MNHRFLSVVGLAAAMAFAAGCNTNKGAVKANDKAAANAKTEVTVAGSVPVWAPEKHQFNPSRTLENDLLHTTLRVSFDWQQQHVHGLAEITAKPYFYSQSRLVLDAQGFDIHGVSLMKGHEGTPLKFEYDGQKLDIQLDKIYTRNEKYKIEIDYTAKPNELKNPGTEAIAEDKGLYFINPLGQEPDKPRQIWTQGETQASSAWFPTVDAPNERMTQEIYITIEPDFTTLSNGTFMYSRQNADGTKTDYWKQDLPHAPYLTMLAIGEYAVVKDKWRDKEVNYYVEPAYKTTAKKIFGHTPEMMEFFSKKLGVAYPWEKYSQVVVRDFVSGAMENTSASTFMEDLQLNERELLDKNWDGIIAHELFHQWFGNYVTTESWANLPLNEAFANYSEYLWAEHKYGADEAAYAHLEELNQYLSEAETKREPLIRYHYKHRDDMFDSHSYAKGGRVLHMLRKYVGDEAFWASLNLYLSKNKFSAVEVAELRMAFEDVTGQDLMWFFDQWFMKPGHPELEVAHRYASGQLTLEIKQLQDTTYMPVYRLPLDVAIWSGGKRIVHSIEINKATQTFTFPVPAQPQLVLFDAQQQLLGTIVHEKSDQELIYQFYNTKQVVPKLESLVTLKGKLNDPEVLELMQDALEDSFWVIRSAAINAISTLEKQEAAGVEAKIKRIAMQDKKGAVRADALLTLAGWDGQAYKTLFEQALNDSSYQVTAAAILAYAGTGAPDTMQKLAAFDKETNEDIVLALANLYAMQGGQAKYSWFMDKLKRMKTGGLYFLLQGFAAYLATTPEANTPEAINFLAGLAKNHNQYYVRVAAYQGLMVMSDKSEVKELLDEIIVQEKDPRALEMYGRSQ